MAILPTIDILKAILVPGLIALAIYLSAIYIFYPLYLSRQRYAQYLPLSLPSSSSSTTSRENGLLGRAFASVSSLFSGVGFLGRIRGVFLDGIMAGRRGRGSASFDEFYGDEELDDGLGVGVGAGAGAGAGTGTGTGDHGFGRETGRDEGMWNERRLSRELEAGFRDDSDEEGENGGAGVRR